MAEIRIFQVDAFTDRLFAGNPAAVCPLDQWLPDEILQKIARENNLSETAFFVTKGAGFHLRWFTPTHEVDLCGHATLASAFVLFNCLGYAKDKIEFDSRSGILPVTRRDGWIEMDFPDRKPEVCQPPEALLKAFGLENAVCLKQDDYVLVLRDEKSVLAANPDLALLKKLDLRGVAITAPGNGCDFVSRFFAPRFGIDEDPVTGSAHTQLAPYWAEKLKKKELQARQISQRGGEIFCRVENGRVYLAGQAVFYMEGRIHIS